MALGLVPQILNLKPSGDVGLDFDPTNTDPIIRIIIRSRPALESFHQIHQAYEVDLGILRPIHYQVHCIWFQENESRSTSQAYDKMIMFGI